VGAAALVASRATVEPIVIAHRGAPAYRPEHTLASYELAIALGADFIEPDLVATHDHRLVARHENDITATTDVAAHPELADRRATKVIDGVEHTGWFTEDLTLAELRSLRAVERIPDLRPANAAWDGRLGVPTLEEILELAARAGVGVYPETKHPTYFREIGLPLEEPLVEALAARTDVPAFIQSFEQGNLRRLRAMTGVPLIQLTTPARAPWDRPETDLLAELEAVAEYAAGIGPAKAQLDASLVERAHELDLLVHPWTYRPENAFLPEALQAGDPGHPEHRRARGDDATELRRALDLGVDGVFADDPGTAVAVRHSRGRYRSTTSSSGSRR
jgi:glycerophosphoryl diester phosphodiesterase